MRAVKGCRPRLLACLAMLCAALALPAVASASVILGDRDVVRPMLKVNAAGVALVEYRTRAGLARHVLIWGAVNGLANPTLGSTQQTFKLDYSGGWKSRQNAGFWKTFKDRCSAYDGPALPFFVAGCKAADGSYWALQAWQRNLPMRGFDPWRPEQSALELHVSHWAGALPVLEIYRHWSYGEAQQGLFGRLMYQGQQVFGTRTSSASVTDVWARNVYIDTFDSDYGPGWRHDTAIATHPRNGGFCYSFVPQAPPLGYPSTKPNGNGLGTQLRVTAIGPGATPIIQWVGAKLASHDGALQEAATQRFDELLGSDAHCAPER